jgi:hypothetical protein
MDIDEAMLNAAKKYYEGAGFDTYKEHTGKPSKYSKEALDKLEPTVKPKGVKNARK